MIKAQIYRIESFQSYETYYCSYPNCRFSLDVGTYCVKFELGTNRATVVYCQNCSKKLLNELKPIMNSDLWSLHD